MDHIIAHLKDSKDLVECCTELRDLSRITTLSDWAGFHKLCCLYHDLLGQKSLQEEVKLVTLTIANLLLKTADFRNYVLESDSTLIEDVQVQLHGYSSSLIDMLPLLRILFLLSHGKSHTDVCPFDRQLIYECFSILMDEIPGSDSNTVELVLLELGKYWYALCYNYGHSQINAKKYWKLFTRLNKLSYQQKIIGALTDPLIQFGSLVLLLQDYELTTSYEMIYNFLTILKRSLQQWSKKMSYEWYVSLEDFKLPQILNITETLIKNSKQSLRVKIKGSFLSDYDSCLNIHNEILELIDSPISSNVHDTMNNIAQLLDIELKKNSEGVSVLVDRVSSATKKSQDKSDSSLVTFSSIASSYVGIGTNLLLPSNGKKAHVLDSDDDDGDNDNDEEWTEEEKIAEAERVMHAINRLNKLGVIRMVNK